ncbi:MAG: DNA translocase FtsK, partial [Rhizobiaceae bacterium]|nr:DNA translocase FtsK [Rhizobiaceae bacterium]
MRTGHSLVMDDSGHGLSGFVRRLLRRITGVAMLLGTGFAVASLATWNVADPSFSHATDMLATNAMGFAGAAFSDLAMQFYGLASLGLLLPGVAWAIRLVSGAAIDRPLKRGAAWIGASLAGAALVGCVSAPESWPLPSGLGGVFGDMVLAVPGFFVGGYPTGLSAILIMLVLAAPALWLFAFASSLIGRDSGHADIGDYDDEFDDEDAGDGEGLLALGALTHWWLSMRGFVRRRFSFAGKRGRMEPDYEEDDYPDELPVAARAPGGRIEPEFADLGRGAPEIEADYDDFEDDDSFEPAQASAPGVARVEGPAPRPQQGARIRREAQRSLIGSGEFELPSLHLLAEPKNVVQDQSLSNEALEQNARLLEGVLEDFGVKGEIIHVRPGPVVTLYELEPAPGIKSSRVIGLADDIARSMSAIACRVAVVPGRNAIGIELPNARRETVYLREILASRDFEQTKTKLALTLGKTIGGEAVIADLAKMPHLLVAGTTGSGKSVAINTMILSLVYRMTPEQCRLIMIDPKMLELSVYDGIPHLLTPVVTDPKKAVVALKW